MRTNKVVTILIVLADFILVPIMFPIQSIRAFIISKRYDMTFNEFWSAFWYGIKEGVRANFRYLKSNDLSDFE